MFNVCHITFARKVESDPAGFGLFAEKGVQTTIRFSYNTLKS